MMWTYNQATGVFSSGLSSFVGYAGIGKGRNNPESEATHDVGPLPRGVYKIAPPRTHPTLGQYVMPLLPAATNKMFGRGGFYIHDDSSKHPGLSSHGCIVLNRAARTAIWMSGNHDLVVV